jgi:hypothetical protein
VRSAPSSLAVASGLALSLTACGPTADGAADAHLIRNAIVGGTPTTSDTNVYLLFIGSASGGSICTATLIAPRTLLTAAHCVDPRAQGATSLSLSATNAPTEDTVVWGANTVPVTETRLHPAWNPASLANDVALALLATPQADVTPKPWNAESLQGYSGKPVRAVGYGSTGNGAGSGTRRTVDLTIRQVGQQLLWLGNLVDKGICHGDSGGPTFHTFADGVERVVGVHSFTRGDACVDGADTRVDVYRDFIRQWLSEKEDECGANGICAVGACATPDPDCLAEGERCTTAFQCRGRQCAADAQQPLTYCTRRCASSTDCEAGMECDASRQVCQHRQLPRVAVDALCTPGEQWCGPDAVCAAEAGAATRCRRPCGVTADCPTPQRCRSATNGMNVCVDPPPVSVPFASAEGPAASGCATAATVTPGLALVLALLRRRAGRSS